MILVWAGLGLVASALLWRLLQGVFAQPVLQRTNVHGDDVPTAGGIVVVVAVLGVAAAAQLVGRQRQMLPELVHAAHLCLAFGALGVFDDLAGDNAKGFRGHLRALREGRLTSGGVKLLGGVAIALIAMGASASLLTKIGGAVVIAGSANLGNLFDRAPGRTIKVSLLAAIPLMAGDFRFGLALVIGAALGVFGADLRAKVMLGDTGANVLGAVIGFAIVVATVGGAGLGVAAGAVVVLNLLSEGVSFSKVIASVPPLRWFDGLGRNT